MTEKEKRQIIDLWESGVTLEQIYQMLPYKRYHSLLMVQELRADGTLKDRNLMQTSIQKVVDVWRTQTKDIREISDILGFTEKTVNKYLEYSGVRNRKHSIKKCSAKTREIQNDLREGKSMVEIARDFGVSRQYVHILKKAMEASNELHK